MRRSLTVLVAIILSLAIMACSLANLAPEEEARLTAIPTRTPQPTFTSTATATATQIPSPTPTPTHTPTATPIPTDTPTPTDTPPPTDTPTITPTPTNTLPPTATTVPTNTPRPTPRPTRRPTNTPVPRPTNTPPPPFSGTIVRGHPHCGGYAGVTGFVYHANGAPYPNVAIGVWSNDWIGRVRLSQNDGKFEVPLSDLPVGHYFVAVVDWNSCTKQGAEPIATSCRRLSNVLEVTVTEFCEVNRVTEVEFTGP